MVSKHDRDWDINPRAFDGLPPRVQEYVRWRLLGLSWGQIAVKMRITRRTVYAYAVQSASIYDRRISEQ